MNEQTEHNMNEAIEWLQNTASGLSNFTMEQAPLYCQELLLYRFIESVSLAIILGLAAASLFVLTIFLWKKCADCELIERSGACFLPVLFCALTTSCAVAATLDAIMIKIAPRVVVVEHLKSLTAAE